MLLVCNASGPSMGTWTVTIQNPVTPPNGTPPIPIPPTPIPPTPTPQPPIGYGMTEWVRANLVLVVNDPQKDATRARLSRSYELYATAGGVAKDPKEFAKGQDALNQITFTITGNADKWDKFMRAMAQKLASLNFTAVPQCQEAWREISVGFQG
jgi:hypothetical protein